MLIGSVFILLISNFYVLPVSALFDPNKDTNIDLYEDSPEYDEGSDDEHLTEAQKSKWSESIQEHYSLSDENMKILDDSGLNHSQKIKSVQLSESSHTPLDEVLKMRSDKMGWGKIAKELGVHPGELGKGNASVKKKFYNEIGLEVN